MPLTSESKRELIGQNRMHEKDTGSSEVQISLSPRGLMSLPSTSRSMRRTTTPVSACSSSSESADAF